MNIRGLDHMTTEQLADELAKGGRFVYYEFCISLIVVSLRRPSAVYFLRGKQWAFWRGIPYSLLSLLLGWWGIPWGLVYTPLVLVNNLAGGCDVTDLVDWRAALTETN
ncbi:MAG: hypothetical protein ACK4RK_14380 [Gemmataceae bacterium]